MDLTGGHCKYRTYLRGGPTDVLLSAYTDWVQGGLTDTRLYVFDNRGSLMVSGTTPVLNC